MWPPDLLLHDGGSGDVRDAELLPKLHVGQVLFAVYTTQFPHNRPGEFLLSPLQDDWARLPSLPTWARTCAEVPHASLGLERPVRVGVLSGTGEGNEPEGDSVVAGKPRQVPPLLASEALDLGDLLGWQTVLGTGLGEGWVSLQE